MYKVIFFNGEIGLPTGPQDLHIAETPREVIRLAMGVDILNASDPRTLRIDIERAADGALLALRVSDPVGYERFVAEYWPSALQPNPGKLDWRAMPSRNIQRALRRYYRWQARILETSADHRLIDDGERVASTPLDRHTAVARLPMGVAP